MPPVPWTTATIASPSAAFAASRSMPAAAFLLAFLPKNVDAVLDRRSRRRAPSRPSAVHWSLSAFSSSSFLAAAAVASDLRRARAPPARRSTTAA